MAQFPNVVIGGIGETKKHRPATQEEYVSVEEYFQRAAELTLDDAGFAKAEIDGIGLIRPNHRESPRYVEMLAETLGFENLEWFTVADHGGASATQLVLEAALAVQQGIVDTMLCLGAETSCVPGESGPPLPSPTQGYEPNYMAPFGYQGPISHLALIQNRYEANYDLEEETLAKVAVTQREHAMRNPLAFMDEPLDVSDYLDAPVFADPVRLLDFVVPVNAGHGVLLTRSEVFDSQTESPISIGGFGAVNINEETEAQSEITATGIRTAGGRAFDRSGVSPESLDFLQLYDNCLLSVILQLEEIGFAEKGGGGAFVETTDLSASGDVPVNTGGGQISAGQAGRTGGFIQILEAVRQLRGDGGDRQIANAERGIVTNLGGLSYERTCQQAHAVILQGSDAA